MQRASRVGLAALSFLLAACGSALRDAARFDGTERASIYGAADVGEAAALPDGYEELGQVSSQCTLDAEPRAMDDEWLSDVDCGTERLTRVLREQAAEVGGELLISKGCESRPTDDRHVTGIVCRAMVARPGDDVLAARKAAPSTPRPGRVEPYPVDEPKASEAWRIRIDTTPSDRVATRAQYRGDLVREVPALPAADVRIADVVARCDRGCSERGARSAVRYAAGRMGASDAADVRCIQHGEGWMCMGTAGGHTVDPATNSAAR